MKEITENMKAILQLHQLHTQLIKKTDQALSVHGISFSEFMVMQQLSTAPEKKMRRIDLAENIGLSASGVTRLLIPMEKIHLVEKQSHPRDARVSFIKLSSAGEELFNNAFTTFQHTSESLTKNLNTKQINTLVGALLQSTS